MTNSSTVHCFFHKKDSTLLENAHLSDFFEVALSPRLVDEEASPLLRKRKKNKDFCSAKKRGLSQAVSAVRELRGDASIVVVRGAPRFLFDLAFDLEVRDFEHLA